MSQNPALEAARQCSTLSDAYRKVVGICGDAVAVRTLDDEISWTWNEFLARTDAVAGGLAGLGVKRGDPVALMLANRPEFFVADLAAVTLGAVPFSIYQTLAPEQIEYVVGDAGARVAIIERAFYDQFETARKGLSNLEHVIVIDDELPNTTTLQQVEQSGAGFDGEAAAAAVEPDDLVTLIYTSGTTGPPKGVELSHRNLFNTLTALTSIVDLPLSARIISWLPTAHIAERALNYYISIASGGTVTTCPNPREIATYLPKVKPHFFFAVPRIWEKMKAGLEAQLSAQPEEQRKAMEDALALARERLRKQQAGEPVPAEMEENVRKADAPATAAGWTPTVVYGSPAAAAISSLPAASTCRRARCSSSSTRSASSSPKAGECPRPPPSAPRCGPTKSASARWARPCPAPRSSSPTTERS